MRAFIEKIKERVPSDQSNIAAWSRLQDASFDNLKLGKLSGLELSFPQPVEIKEVLPPSSMVFINGHFDPKMSNAPGLNLTTFEKAKTTYGAFLKNRRQQLLKSEKDPLALINLALSETGAFLYLPPNTIVENPLQVVFASSCKIPNAILNPALQIFIGKNSKLDIIFSYVDLDIAPIFNNQFVDLVIEEGAQVRSQNLSQSRSTMHFETFRAKLKKNSSYEHLFITNGADTYRSDFDISLEGENGYANIYGLAMLEGEKEANINVTLRHLEPHCQSKQLIKTVLNGKSRSIFNGKIYIDAKAYKTNADQKNNNLLLSPEAVAKSNPTLEIFADDVKASHGATFGQIDKNSLFYLKSRGLSEENAKELLVEAFCAEIKEKICLSK